MVSLRIISAATIHNNVWRNNPIVFSGKNILMKSAASIGIEWTVGSVRSDGKFHGKSFGSEADARSYARELASSGHSDISVTKSKLKK